MTNRTISLYIESLTSNKKTAEFRQPLANADILSTPEHLPRNPDLIMAANKGQASLISSEGGIFDTLIGLYSKAVNIDVMLKGYSGDTIRVDRIGRERTALGA